MKTHEHALLSLGYAAGVALLAGGNVADPALYISALVGGELIDIIDHPLYHLVYRRNDPWVVKARQTLREKGVWAAVATLNEIEDARGFKGLLLHNVYSLSLVAMLLILAAFFLPAPYYVFVGAGAFILHMITDTVGDFIVLGHVNNWLWVLPRRVLDVFGRMGKGLVFVVMGWGLFIQAGLALATFRWAHALALKAADSQSATSVSFSELGLAYHPGLYTLETLAYLPLVMLVIYHLNVLGICLGGVHKYRQEIKSNPKAVPFTMGSMKLLLRLLGRKMPWTRKNFERVYLYMQADQGPWIIFLTVIISTILLLMTFLWGPYKDPGTGGILWRAEWQMAFVITPVFFALLFGTLIHTTVGEFGGVWGVFLAWMLNIFLGRLGLQALWDVSQGYLVFGAALGAWVMGLLGGMLLKGKMRMSILAFTIQVKREKDADDWLNDTVSLVREGLQNGFTVSHETLFGPAKGKNFIWEEQATLLFSPYEGPPVLGEDYYHLRADDSFAPMLQEYGYVLCDNQLTSTSTKLGKYGWLPAMPRQRKFSSETSFGDMVLVGSTYCWQSQRRPIVFERAITEPAQQNTGTSSVLYKTWGEYFDHVVTRKDTIRADIFVYSDANQPDSVSICGLVCEFTSTKEFATVESEVYAGAVFKQIGELIGSRTGLNVQKKAVARLFFPRISFWDIELVDSMEHQAGLPSDGGRFQRQDIDFIRKSLRYLPNKNLISNASADFLAKVRTLAAEYALTTVVGLINFNPAIRDFVVKILHGFFE